MYVSTYPLCGQVYSVLMRTLSLSFTASVIINIDVIGGSNVESLPVASTCSLRMSIPLYPSYNILKRKLMQAIQCQAYGLG